MATRKRGNIVSKIGSTNVSTLTYTAPPLAYSSGGIPQGYIVKLDTADTTRDAVTLAGVGDLPYGIADTYPAIGPGDPVQVQLDGIARVAVGAATSKGDYLVPDATGRAVTPPALGATSVYTLGIGEEPGVQAGDYITVRLAIGTLKVTA